MRSILLGIFGFCAVFAPIHTTPVHAADPVSLLGKQIDDFQVTDFRGREYAMKDFADSKVLVVAFLGTQCPLAKLYAGRISELNELFSDEQVAFLAVDSNDQDSLAEMGAFANRHGINFPFAKDAGQRLADQLGATRTPEVFVLDQQRQIRYWGRIDDQYGIGYIRDSAESHELKDAVQQLLNNHDPKVAHQPAVGCIIGRRKIADPNAEITYSSHVAAIFNSKCVECHRAGEIGPFAMTDYEEVAPWADMIAEVVLDKRMPPWHANPAHGKFTNDRSLTTEQRELIQKWAAAGAPLGDPNEVPPIPTFVQGWQLPREPDLVVSISETPVPVPATGEVKYKYYVVDPKITEEKWISAAELLPGNRAVVHHILAFARPKGSNDRMNAERGFLVGYVPGSRVYPFEKGMAKRIPAGSELVFQVHYTPIGVDTTDSSKLGIVYADPKEVTHEVITTSCVQTNLRIPANNNNHEVSALLPETLPNCQLLAMSPHMHLRGKAFRYTAINANGDREILLDIPRYDFNWQTAYLVDGFKELSEGSRILCEAAFDNSSANLNNPAPDQEVRWGDQTWEEMMIGYFDVAVPLDLTSEAKKPTAKIQPQNPLSPESIMSRLDKNQDGNLQADEIPSRYRAVFQRLDADGDGVVTMEELKKAGS